MHPKLAERIERLPPIALDELDKRAALQRRTDQKYLVETAPLAELLESMEGDHEVLEIDGRREFGYESNYFDTPGLVSFHEHVADRVPRFKARTRWYVQSGTCNFEVKLKLDDDETLKRSLDHDPERRHELTPAARELLECVLGERGIVLQRDHLDQTLVTRFTRVTLVAADAAERTTVDVALELDAPGAGSLVMRDGHAVVESKTEDGDGRVDRLMAERGIHPVGFSKYRFAVGALRAPGSDPGYAEKALPLFELRARDATGGR